MFALPTPPGDKSPGYSNPPYKMGLERPVHGPILHSQAIYRLVGTEMQSYARRLLSFNFVNFALLARFAVALLSKSPPDKPRSLFPLASGRAKNL